MADFKGCSYWVFFSLFCSWSYRTSMAWLYTWGCQATAIVLGPIQKHGFALHLGMSGNGAGAERGLQHTPFTARGYT